MKDAGCDLRIAVLGDSSATLYSQEDPHQTLRELGAQPWPEAMTRVAEPTRLEVLNLARVGQRLCDGLKRRYQSLPDFAPDVVVVMHGGREGILGLPRALGWLRSYAHSGAPSSGNRFLDLIRRPLWRALVGLVDRRPRLAQRLLWPLGIRPVQSDTTLYREQLEELVRSAVEDLNADVVLLTTNLGYQSYWPIFRHILAANDATAGSLADRYPDRVSVLELRPQLATSAFAEDGAHLTPQGHWQAAHIVWDHVQSRVLGRNAEAQLLRMAAR